MAKADKLKTGGAAGVSSAGTITLDDYPMRGASLEPRPTRPDSPPAVKDDQQKPLRKVGPEDEDRKVRPGEAGANDD
jgi:hypothetical protein